ncbi:C-type lectin domain family 17, member A-like isoform X2 [Pleurodeles waltl]|uniref:C-type lectin domain family 17, member A-like isoform X2 n=1 Tax=Pleurodeles waltl TaxID=8319 RepID=UPI003709AF1B
MNHLDLEEPPACTMVAGQQGCGWECDKRLWRTLLAGCGLILVFAQFIMSVLMLVKSYENSAKLEAAELDYSTMKANVSRDLLKVQSNHNEIKQILESEMATFHASFDSLIMCPVGWKACAVKCYFFSSVQKTWESAKVDCDRRGSHLVAVESQEEQMFLAQNLNGQVHWIGLRYSAQNGTWQWVNGAPLGVRYWRPGEPNNAKEGENCAEMEPTTSWNDDDCSQNHHWICEKRLF